MRKPVKLQGELKAGSPVVETSGAGPSVAGVSVQELLEMDLNDLVVERVVLENMLRAAHIA